MANNAIARVWQPIPHPNQRFRVFQGPLDDDGNPIHLVLTSRDDSGDAPLRVSEAVLLLAEVEERSLDEVVADNLSQTLSWHPSLII